MADDNDQSQSSAHATGQLPAAHVPAADLAVGRQPAAEAGPPTPVEAGNAATGETADGEVAHGPNVVRRAVHGAGDVVGSVGSAGRSIGHLATPVVTRVRPRMGAAARRWKNRQAARMARLRGLNREPLPNLYEIHPEARLAPVHELGFQTIPVAEIVGTAVEGPQQRGRDFLPPPPFRSKNWSARWQRIMNAVDNLGILPPIEVIKAGGVYWVVDGHNRVAAALYGNQVAIDALVSAARLPGDPIETPGPLASMLGRPDGLGRPGHFVSRPPLGATTGEGPDVASSGHESRGSDAKPA